MSNATGERPTRRQVKSAIRKLIMYSTDPAMAVAHLHWAIDDAEKARMKKDGKRHDEGGHHA